MEQIDLRELNELIKRALKEDLGKGDITSEAVLPHWKRARAKIIAKEDGVLAGLFVAELIFKTINKKTIFTRKKHEGEEIKKGTVLAEVEGLASDILAAERTALNFLQRLSGIATLTHAFVKKASGLPVQIKDTRKTTPTLRQLEKYAVRVAGGTNHREGLFDEVLIKDNHIKAARGIEKVVKLAREKIPADKKIEVEADSVANVAKAIKVKANIIMLDNMSMRKLKRSVGLVKKHNQQNLRPEAYIETEVSGGVNLDNVREIAELGVDSISVGALTHSAKALDISLKFV
ncbi:MAG: carboxylating nicotinate-nucleotide diphosphorylase [Candidatus Margulisbacteria bacterium]|nr:carboxylating nicotinate-nucleotide diphosphorylase [Candidatus Margulisiibacteriota bacterium]MBU1021952.1 carboxylating nicotinate-nucleotide diphosphorylase [Candidatus Margulisiibacteriota bacterium]MBU1728931.1 carboxylating nicotinate-nucleotide diphosphorylase [Candidatus Margulisiibacteriota bacterium]MBU1954737.1 carboxylating nicotinate-nucleotide diphosphorylase [Candidatus Margulisiibacteriota bacterium]